MKKAIGWIGLFSLAFGLALANTAKGQGGISWVDVGYFLARLATVSSTVLVIVFFVWLISE